LDWRNLLRSGWADPSLSFDDAAAVRRFIAQELPVVLA
jgi:hypothetical protein